MIHIYTGNGKGKTTAALGLALRAAGAGFKVYIIQFCKGKTCGEHIAIKKIRNIRLRHCGRPALIRCPQKKDIALARQGINRALSAIASKKYRMVILDEVFVALKLRLITSNDLTSLIHRTPSTVELILTGRGAPKQIIALSDLTSDIREKRHYYKNGAVARSGIEF